MCTSDTVTFHSWAWHEVRENQGSRSLLMVDYPNLTHVMHYVMSVTPKWCLCLISRDMTL